MLALRTAPLVSRAPSSASGDVDVESCHPGGSVPLVSKQPARELRCYDVLGVSRFASPSEIRHAYRHRSLSLHPDKRHGQLAGFLSLAEAFEVLSEPSRRGAYDRELINSKSRDGIGAGDSTHAVVTICPHRDYVILCMALLEIPPQEWTKHIAEIPTATLKEMHEHLADSIRRGGAGVKRSRLEPEGPNSEKEELGVSRPRHLCFGNNRRRGYYCAQIQMCGIHVRTFSTRHLVTAAEAHLALIALKEIFFGKWRENGMADFDEVLRASAVEAGLQKMYFPSAMHWFEKVVEPEPGVKWRLTTPCTRDLESTLKNRSEVLQLLNRGADKYVFQKAIEDMREAEKAAKAAWEELRPSIEHRLFGFLSCELDHRLGAGVQAMKRRRLHGKQSLTQLCVQLPWFGRFAAEHSISAADLEALLPPLQTRLRGVPSLEQCLQRALRNSLLASGQLAPLEDAPRKSITSSSSALPALAASGQRRAKDELAAPTSSPCKEEALAALPLYLQQEQELGREQHREQREQQQRQQRQQQQQQALPSLSQPSLEAPPLEALAALLQPARQPQVSQGPPRSPRRPPERPGALQQPQELRRSPRRSPQLDPRRQTPQPMTPLDLPPPLQQQDSMLEEPSEPQGQRPLDPPPRKHSGHKRVQAPVTLEATAELAEPPHALGSPGRMVTRMLTRRSVSPGRTSRDVSPVPRSQQGRSRSAPRKCWRECYSLILQELLADSEVDRLFGQPVDIEMYPDYLEKIAPNRPVDLRLIMDRLGLEEKGYSDVDECSADVSMVWENAARFNAPGSYVRAIAEQAAKIINELLLGRRSGGRIWCRAPSPGHRSSLRPETRSRSETRARSQLSVQFGNESSVPKTP